MSLIKFGKFVAINLQIFSVLLSLSSSGTPIKHMLVHLMMPHRSVRLCFGFFFLFPAPQTGYFFMVLSSSLLILSSASSNLLLNPCSEFFIIGIVFFSYRMVPFYNGLIFFHTLFS